MPDASGRPAETKPVFHVLLSERTTSRIPEVILSDEVVGTQRCMGAGQENRLRS